MPWRNKKIGVPYFSPDTSWADILEWERNMVVTYYTHHEKSGRRPSMERCDKHGIVDHSESKAVDMSDVPLVVVVLCDAIAADFLDPDRDLAAWCRQSRVSESIQTKEYRDTEKAINALGRRCVERGALSAVVKGKSCCVLWCLLGKLIDCCRASSAVRRGSFASRPGSFASRRGSFASRRGSNQSQGSSPRGEPDVVSVGLVPDIVCAQLLQAWQRAPAWAAPRTGRGRCAAFAHSVQTWLQDWDRVLQCLRNLSVIMNKFAVADATRCGVLYRILSCAHECVSRTAALDKGCGISAWAAQKGESKCPDQMLDNILFLGEYLVDLLFDPDPTRPDVLVLSGSANDQDSEVEVGKGFQEDESEIDKDVLGSGAAGLGMSSVLADSDECRWHFFICAVLFPDEIFSPFSEVAAQIWDSPQKQPSEASEPDRQGSGFGNQPSEVPPDVPPARSIQPSASWRTDFDSAESSPEQQGRARPALPSPPQSPPGRPGPPPSPPASSADPPESDGAHSGLGSHRAPIRQISSVTRVATEPVAAGAAGSDPAAATAACSSSILRPSARDAGAEPGATLPRRNSQVTFSLGDREGGKQADGAPLSGAAASQQQQQQQQEQLTAQQQSAPPRDPADACLTPPTRSSAAPPAPQPQQQQQQEQVRGAAAPAALPPQQSADPSGAVFTPSSFEADDAPAFSGSEFSDSATPRGRASPHLLTAAGEQGHGGPPALRLQPPASVAPLRPSSPTAVPPRSLTPLVTNPLAGPRPGRDTPLMRGSPRNSAFGRLDDASNGGSSRDAPHRRGGPPSVSPYEIRRLDERIEEFSRRVTARIEALTAETRATARRAQRSAAAQEQLQAHVQQLDAEVETEFVSARAEVAALARELRSAPALQMEYAMRDAVAAQQQQQQQPGAGAEAAALAEQVRLLSERLAGVERAQQQQLQQSPRRAAPPPAVHSDAVAAELAALRADRDAQAAAVEGLQRELARERALREHDTAEHRRDIDGVADAIRAAAAALDALQNEVSEQRDSWRRESLEHQVILGDLRRDFAEQRQALDELRGFVDAEDRAASDRGAAIRALQQELGLLRKRFENRRFTDPAPLSDAGNYSNTSAHGGKSPGVSSRFPPSRLRGPSPIAGAPPPKGALDLPEVVEPGEIDPAGLRADRTQSALGRYLQGLPRPGASTQEHSASLHSNAGSVARRAAHGGAPPRPHTAPALPGSPPATVESRLTELSQQLRDAPPRPLATVAW